MKSHLTPEQQALIAKVEANKQAAAQPAAPIQPQVSFAVSNLDAQLAPIQDALKAILNKPLPEIPDNAQPIVQAVSRLQEAITQALTAINVKPEFKPNIQVATPKVSIDAPKIDLSGIEQILRKDVPNAFKKAIDGIPEVEMPEQDNTDIVDKLKEMSEQLDSINTGTRMKPQFPTTLKVTNPDGSNVATTPTRALKGEQVTTITSSTTETTIATAIASTYIDVYGLVLTNSSATATKVTVRDATAGGTARVYYVPAGDMRGFMLPASSALKQATLNNNWTAQCTTSVASLDVQVLYVKST